MIVTVKIEMLETVLVNGTSIRKGTQLTMPQKSLVEKGVMFNDILIRRKYFKTIPTRQHFEFEGDK